MLTDKEIQDIAQPFIRECGDYSAHEEAIPYRDTEDFARAIEKAVLFEKAEDIMKILTCYSARFYGRRGGRKKKNTAENESVESNGI